MDLRVASQTDRGRVRDQNEDAVLADLPLVAVADGVGGHKAGEVASALALQTVAQWKDRLEGKEGMGAAETLKDALTEANRVVWERSRDDDAVAGMGTTLTAAWLEGDRAALAHVGDSRAYLLRGSKLSMLTEDQTVAQQWVKQGKLSEDEAASSPQRHIILQAIGTGPGTLDIDIATVELRPGDRLLLATDGLFGMVRDEARIKEILAAHADPSEASRALIAAANAAGGEDNISVVIVDAGELPAIAPTDTPVVIQRPGAAGPRRRRLGGRTLAIGAVSAVALLLVAGAIIWMSSGPSYVLSSRGGQVVVLDGRPGRDDAPARGEVVRVFEDEPIERFSKPARDQLRTGIPVESMAEAERRVSNLPRLLGPQDTPTPTPTDPVTSPGAELSPGVSPPPSPVPLGTP